MPESVFLLHIVPGNFLKLLVDIAASTRNQLFVTLKPSDCERGRPLKVLFRHTAEPGRTSFDAGLVTKLGGSKGV